MLFLCISGSFENITFQSNDYLYIIAQQGFSHNDYHWADLIGQTSFALKQWFSNFLTQRHPVSNNIQKLSYTGYFKYFYYKTKRLHFFQLFIMILNEPTVYAPIKNNYRRRIFKFYYIIIKNASLFYVFSI